MEIFGKVAVREDKSLKTAFCLCLHHPGSVSASCPGPEQQGGYFEG